MIPGLDIYRSANVLIREHGEGVGLGAARRANAVLEKGDLAVCFWPKADIGEVGRLLKQAPNI